MGPVVVVTIADVLTSTRRAKGDPRCMGGTDMRMSVGERRDQLVEAAITVASRDGIDATTLRAIAAEAGASLGSVHYCFEDKDALLSAMAFAITRRHISPVLMDMLVHGDVTVLIQRAIDVLWGAVTATHDEQLLTYELTTYSLRHPELRQVSVTQYMESHAAAREFLEALAVSADVEWTVPLETLTRMVTTTVDGVVLAWLTDGSDEAAREVLREFGKYLATCIRPRTRTAPDGHSERRQTSPTKQHGGFRLFVLPSTLPAPGTR